jgi:histidine triad (HIT) family protein
MNNECIFCRIIKKEVSSAIVYEDDKFFGFLDHTPVVKGHMLLIPREHHTWIHEMPDELLAEAFITSKKLINAMRKGFECDFVQLSVVGKDVPHFHIHLFPRWMNDNLAKFETTKYESEQEQNEVAEKIKNSLK